MRDDRSERGDRLERLIETIASEIRRGRIGRPVSVRATLELTSDHGRLVSEITRILGTAFGWLADDPVAVQASGSPASGHVTALARGQGGTTALAAAALLRGGAPRVDLLVLGSAGTLLHEGEANALELEAGSSRWAERELADDEKTIFRAVEESLRTGESAPVRRAAAETPK